jgi:PAS domain S-box-containing protein
MDSSPRSYHIEFLRAELERRKSKNSRYSMRAFASFLEIHPSALSRMLNGLQDISLQVALLVLKQLKMTEEEKRLFLASVAEEKRFQASQVLADAINLPIDDFLQVASVGTPHLHTQQVLLVAPFYTFVINTQRHFLFASDSGAKWLGLRPCEVIGRSISDVNLTDGFCRPMTTLHEQALSTKAGGIQEILHEDPVDKSIHYYEITASPLISDIGDVQSVVFAIHEVTTQKLAHAETEKQLVQEQNLRREAEMAASRARLLQSLSTALADASTREAIAQCVISRLLAPFESAGGVILLTNHDGRYLEPIITSSPKTTLKTGRISFDFKTPAAHVARTNEPVWMTRIGSETEESGGANSFEPGVRWVSGLPLTVHGHVIGVLGLRFRHERKTSDAEKALLETVSNLTAQALDRVLFAKETERNRALLDTIFHEAPVGILFVDTNFRTVRANDELARYAEKPLNSFIGQSIREFPVGSFGSIEPLLREALASGQAVRNFPFEVRSEEMPGKSRHFSASIYPVRNGVGEILGAGAIIMEETERVLVQRQEEKRRTLLINAGRVLGSTLNSKTTLKQLTQLIVPALAIGCRVDLLDRGQDLKVAEYEHADSDVAPFLKDPDFTCPKFVLHNGEPEFLKTDRGDSVLCVPIEADGQPIGTLTLISSDENGNFSEADVNIAVELAERAAIAIRNAQKFEEARGHAPLNH